MPAPRFTFSYFSYPPQAHLHRDGITHSGPVNSLAGQLDGCNSSAEAPSCQVSQSRPHITSFFFLMYGLRFILGVYLTGHFECHHREYTSLNLKLLKLIKHEDFPN